MFGSRRRSRKERSVPSTVSDDVLGEIAYDRTSDAWVAAVGPDGVKLEFASGPSSGEAIEYARRLVREFDSFVRRVSDFLEAEARAGDAVHNPRPSPAEVYRQLRIEAVSIFDGHRGMIWFAGGPDDMVFRCDLIDGVPQVLVCDT